MNSPDHRAQILDSGYTQMGVGTAVDDNGTLWVAGGLPDADRRHPAVRRVWDSQAPSTSTTDHEHARRDRHQPWRPGTPRPSRSCGRTSASAREKVADRQSRRQGERPHRAALRLLHGDGHRRPADGPRQRLGSMLGSTSARNPTTSRPSPPPGSRRRRGGAAAGRDRRRSSTSTPALRPSSTSTTRSSAARRSSTSRAGSPSASSSPCGDVSSFAWKQAKFRVAGREDIDDMASVDRRRTELRRRSPVDEVVSLGDEIFDERIEDKLYAQTIALTRNHLEAGQRVWLVSAAPGRDGLADRPQARADRRPRHRLGDRRRRVHRASWSARRCTGRPRQRRYGHSPSARASTSRSAPRTPTRPTTSRCCPWSASRSRSTRTPHCAAMPRAMGWHVYDYRTGRKAAKHRRPDSARRRRRGRRRGGSRLQPPSPPDPHLDQCGSSLRP